MITNAHDLFDLVEERNRGLRREAAAYRLSQDYRPAVAPGPSLMDRVRAQMARLHLIRPVANRSEAPA